ncbi:DUF6449 domain-containing protein [Bacillus sp. EB600]|uniref:DUF6449 domain-containing protein n=1 Tax=Bacillus sp. EB600 TaxID=2806345 RepID=UPI00210B79E6|nr:DUF6449 domain-containing protein [Bacillus sp. EB600]MCQ6281913.1 multidrug ABC transporter permease [Bacillus sp. EB600]
MPLKMSLFNKELILQIGRSTGWISIVYILGLLFALPLKMMMMYSDKNHLQNYNKVNNLFQYDFSIQITLLVTIPILLAVFLFRFLHVKQAADHMHSLPLKRGKIFHHYALFGLVFLILPILITAIVVLFTHAAFDLTPYFTKRDVLYWTVITIVVNLILYTGSIFVAMMTGISAVHAVLSYVFLFFPVGIMLLLFYNLKAMLYGFPSDYFLNKDLEKMSPITYAAALDGKPFQLNVAVIYLVFTVILYWLGLFFYKKRKLEAASEAIAFAKLRVVFKYGVTFCTMLAGGMYFSEVQANSLGWTNFGYAVGAVIGYFVANMVLQKTWRVFKSVKGLAVYTVVIIVVVTVVKSLGIYENSIPEQNQIKSAMLTDNPNIFLDQNESYELAFLPKPLYEKGNIKAVRKLHQQILNDKEVNQQENVYQYDLYGPYDPHENAFLIYEMIDGSKVIREYRINKLLYNDFYKPIYESEEYKRNSKEIFKVKENKIKSILITANGPVNKSVTISDPKDVSEMISLLKAEVLAENYEDSVYFRDRGATVEINMGKGRVVNMGIKPSYLKLTKWLADKGLYEKTMVTENDFDYVLVGKNNFAGLKNPDLVVQEMEKQAGIIKVTDKQQMKSTIDHAGVLNTGNYAVVFRYKQGRNYEVFYFDDKHVPDFVKEQIK